MGSLNALGVGKVPGVHRLAVDVELQLVGGAVADTHGPRTAPALEMDPFRPARQQASATVAGVFLPTTAVVFYLAVSVLYIVEPLWHIRIRIRRPAKQG